MVVFVNCASQCLKFPCKHQVATSSWVNECALNRSQQKYRFYRVVRIWANIASATTSFAMLLKLHDKKKTTMHTEPLNTPLLFRTITIHLDYSWRHSEKSKVTTTLNFINGIWIYTPAGPSFFSQILWTVNFSLLPLSIIYRYDASRERQRTPGADSSHSGSHL